MRRIENPRQKRLFDPFERVFSPLAYKTIRKGWQGVFRHVILELMPVDVVAEHFSPDMGTPTKELYSMAGLLLIKEFKNWATADAAEAYMFNTDVQYALNLEPAGQSMSERTIERYEKIFLKNDLAAKVMADVTTKLVDVLQLDISRQRLDSTHVFSDMASFGRTRLLGVTIKRFLTQVKRQDREAYAALPEALRKRYEPSVGKLFGDVAKDADVRRKLRSEVAEEMLFLIETFADAKKISGRATYKNMVKIFEQQCEIVGGKVEVKAHPGGDVIQNPSDPDATYDGHKGPGYQAQICETCSDQNDQQLITSAIPQTAAQTDQDSVEDVLSKLDQNDLLPEVMYADTGYGSDENVQKAAEKGVDLQAPVSGHESPGSSDDLNIDDFVVDKETEQVKRCPAGHEPVRSEHNDQNGKTTTEMPAEACGACEFSGLCPVRRTRGRYIVTHTARQRRLAARRREQDTDPFRENYQIRAGIESTNSGLKRREGLGRLRVRGDPMVFHQILLKIAGWNIFRATASQKMRQLVAELVAKWGYRSHIFAFFQLLDRLMRRIQPLSLFSCKTLALDPQKGFCLAA